MGIANCKDCGKPLVGIHTCTSKRWKEWCGLAKEDVDSIECWFREEIENDRFSVENLIVRIEAKLKERNT